MVPEHHIGVGAQGGDVVDAADDESLLTQGRERLVDLGGEFGPVGVAEFGGRGEDRVRDVAGLLVGAFDLLFGGLRVVAHGVSFVSCVFSAVVGSVFDCRVGLDGAQAVGASVRRSATVCARAMQAGMPTPA